jgi:hypothetical protein
MTDDAPSSRTEFVTCDHSRERTDLLHVEGILITSVCADCGVLLYGEVSRDCDGRWLGGMPEDLQMAVWTEEQG